MRSSMRLRPHRALSKSGGTWAAARQRPVKTVGPAVVAAGEPRFVAVGGVADARAAMPAHVQQRIHDLGALAHDDHGLAGHLEQEVVAPLGNLADMPDIQPGLEEDAAHLLAIDRFALVDGAGKA